ncbi:hypothetical protein K431DRAFT_6221 [Polychaeton citri CBS 116435]|uniref:Uncharacterized protein n=1 Tax=Polychaeton citri CBS 116435 TaxID=1314669 RepID=A0A9P4QHD8_9PEZI|nr:hypothetical protein K431DRAFT_6221 [Polychaeton citri CBS 116435]
MQDPSITDSLSAQQRQPSVGTTNTVSTSPRDSSTPLIPPQQQLQQQAGPSDATALDTGVDEKDAKSRRRFFGLGKKKDDKTSTGAPMLPQTQPAVIPMRPESDTRSAPPPDLRSTAHSIPLSPSRHPYQAAMAASPSRLRSSSPRLHSPASSEIFERNVQEPLPLSTIPDDSSQHLPAHVMTEDHIPPALEATANAITSEELNPDEVEIVTSASHQPAAASMLDASSSQLDLHSPPALHHQQSSGFAESEPRSISPHHHLASGVAPLSAVPQDLLQDDSAGSYGSLDPNDVRRLSFISFADVMQSEHQQPHAPGAGSVSQLADVGSRDSLHLASLPGAIASENPARAASPLRSPRSPASMHRSGSGSGGLTTPPGVNITRDYEQSPVRSVGGFGSPGSSIAQHHGDLTVQTMRQAVRKTASGDLSAGRTGSASVGAMSPVSTHAGGEEGSFREARSRTNS